MRIPNHKAEPNVFVTGAKKSREALIESIQSQIGHNILLIDLNVMPTTSSAVSEASFHSDKLTKKSDLRKPITFLSESSM